MPVTQGVPQGSGLSPLLFNIFARSLPSSCDSPVIQFADDVTASEADKDVDAVFHRLATSYDSIKTFCNDRGLTLNANKTQLIVFKTPAKKISGDIEIILDGISIKPASSVKLLGYNLDQHLTWGEHINKIVKKCNGLIGALAKATPFLSHKLLRMAYIALIRSHLEYCSAVLLSASATQLEKLNVIQRKAARTILQLPRDAHAAPLLESLSLESLDERRNKHVLSVIQKILSGHCHPAIADFFELQSDESVSTSIRSRLKFGNKRFRIIGANIYNNLQQSSEIQNVHRLPIT